MMDIFELKNRAYVSSKAGGIVGVKFEALAGAQPSLERVVGRKGGGETFLNE